MADVNILGQDPDVGQAFEQQGAGDIVNAVPSGAQTPQLAQPPQPQNFGTMTPNPPAQPQQPQGHNVFRSIMETLAGPSYSYQVDPNSGQMVKVANQTRSKSQLANSIVAGALTGLFAGSMQKGPGSALRSLGAGGQAVAQKQQALDEQAREQAQKDFARKASIFDTNMRMRQNAMQLSQMDYNMHKMEVDDGAKLLDQLHKEFPQMILDSHVPVSDLGKYNATIQNAIPDGISPVMGPDGKQKTDAQGVPMWEKTYTIIDSFANPNAKFNIDPDVIKRAKEYGFPEATALEKASNPKSRIEMAINLNSKVHALDVLGAQMKDYYGLMATKNKQVPSGVPFTSTQLRANEDKFGPMIDKAAKDNGIDPALLRGLVNQESGGNEKAVSKKGAQGLGQLMPDTAKALGVTNAFDPQQNINGAAKHLKGLLDKYGDASLALAAYNAGEGAVDKGGAHIPQNGETENYVNAIMNSIKPQGNEPEAKGSEGDESESSLVLPDLKKALRDDPKLQSSLQAFANTSGTIDERMADLRKHNPDAANHIAPLFGGFDAIQQAADLKAARHTAAIDEAKADMKLQSEGKKEKRDEAMIINRNNNLIDALGKGELFDITRIATMRSHDREIIANEVKRRYPDWNPQEVDAAVDLYKDATAASKTGSFANSVSVANTSLGHMASAVKSLHRLAAKSGIDLNDAKILNKTMDKLNEQFGGNEEWTAFKGYLHTAATDWQNLLNNQHALTDYDKEMAKNISDPHQTLKNTLEALQMMEHTAAVRIVPLNERWKQTMRGDFPNLIQPQTIQALKTLNNPEVNEILGDLQSGGTLRGSATGAGSGGTKVRDLLGNKQQTQGQQQGQQPQGRAVYVNGQIVGYTTDGKTMTPVGH